MNELTLEGLKCILNPSEEYDREVVIFKGENLPLGTEPVRLDCFMIILCTEGGIPVRINSKYYELSHEKYAFVLPRSTVQVVDSGDAANREVTVIAFEPSVLDESRFLAYEVWRKCYFLYKDPILSNQLETSYNYYLYLSLLENTAKKNLAYCKRKIMHHVLLAVILELFSPIYERTQEEEESDIALTAADEGIVRRFMEAVADDDGTHRSVSYFADILGCPAKYLSRIVKIGSKICPLKIINDHAMDQIKCDLVHTELSMKVISDKFEFPNPSVFGKYVKTHLGCSPYEYRLAKRV